MTDDRWTLLLDQVKEKFSVLEHKTEPLIAPGQEDIGASVEFIIFESPLGKMRLERTTQPLVIDKKTFGFKRIGSETKVDYIYSDTEKVHKFSVYKWSEALDDWEKLETGKDEFNI